MENQLFYSQSDLVKIKNKIKRIFFYRVCGTGMGAAALLLKDLGHEVVGGDLEFYPPMDQYLKDSKIPLYNLADLPVKFLSDFDLIVVGNVVAKNSVSAKMLESVGRPLTSFPALLGAFWLRNVTNVIGVAGTHGKTTTSYLIKQIFSDLGIDIGHFIGGVLPQDRSAQIGDGQFFVIESDEYDTAYFQKYSKFHEYNIKHLVLTSLEMDHRDIYNDIGEIKKQFIPLLEKTRGHVYYNSQYTEIVNLLEDGKNCFKSINPFGSEKSQLNILSKENGTTFEAKIQGKMEKFSTNLVGTHNVLNLYASILVAHSFNFNLDTIRASLTKLKLPKRRQEYMGTFRGSKVINDFAHHPTAVKLTLQGLRTAYPNNRVVCVFEPASATSRSDFFQKKFLDGLDLADELIIIHPQRQNNIPGRGTLDCTLLRNDLMMNKKNADVKIVESQEQLYDRIIDSIDKHRDDKNVIVFLSNGKLLNIWDSKLKNELIL